jgi:hypothetical protein
MLVAVISISLQVLRPHRSGHIVTDITTWRQYPEIALRGQGARWISLRQPPIGYVFPPMRGSRLQRRLEDSGACWAGGLAGGRAGEAVALSHQISVGSAGSNPLLVDPVQASPDFPQILDPRASHRAMCRMSMANFARSRPQQVQLLSFATDATARSSPRHGRHTLQKPLQEEKGPLETDLPVSPSSSDLIDLECAASPGTSNGRFFQCQRGLSCGRPVVSHAGTWCSQRLPPICSSDHARRG